MTSLIDATSARSGCVAVLALLAACSGDAPVTPRPTETTCGGVPVSVRTLAPFERVVLTGADVTCFALAGDDREYLVVPQLTGESLPYGGYGFRLGDPTAVTARVASGLDADPIWLRAAQGRSGAESVSDAQTQLDARMREREAAVDADPMRHDQAPQLRVRSVAVAVDTMRSFSVLNTLAATPTYASVRAQLRYGGSRVLLYVDTLASAAFTDAELLGIGTLYDQRLAPAVTTNFGEGSDIDGNARVIFVLTPTVNSMVTASQCATSGFVRGFFYNHDLRSAEPTSNRGEVFYAYVPDELGRWSCAHSRSEVLANLPPTFMHELQHMISFGEHFVERNGPSEEVWLNEGLSHMAEEIGSLAYESRFPAPTGRSNPTSIFPDSATPYINPNLLYSYRYLFASATYSITSCAPATFCSLAERGGTWLFLRWIADQQGSGGFRRLVETNLTGRANIEAATGRSTAALLGDFALAVSADSVVGVARNSAPAALRFSSRNLRRLYKSLFDAYGIIGGVGRPFPIEPLVLPAGASVTATMRPGTFLTYRLRIATGAPAAILRLRSIDGTPFPLTSGAQVAVLRLP